MMKKILSLATAALLLAGSLISCGGKTGGSSDTIKIGGVGPTTGCLLRNIRKERRVSCG